MSVMFRTKASMSIIRHKNGCLGLLQSILIYNRKKGKCIGTGPCTLKTFLQ